MRNILREGVPNKTDRIPVSPYLLPSVFLQLIDVFLPEPACVITPLTSVDDAIRAWHCVVVIPQSSYNFDVDGRPREADNKLITMFHDSAIVVCDLPLNLGESASVVSLIFIWIVIRRQAWTWPIFYSNPDGFFVTNWSRRVNTRDLDERHHG